MSGLLLTKDSVSRSKEYLLQYLRDAGYEGSLEDGSGMYDLLIKGFAILHTLFEQQADKTSAYLSLAKAQELKDVLGDEYDTAVDAVLSNWFVSRKGGSPTTGKLRLWFNKPVDFLRLVPGALLFKYQDSFFTVSEEYVFSASDFSEVANTPQSPLEMEYYVDVDVVGTENKALAVSTGDLLSSYINNIYFIRAEAVSDFTAGKAQESSDEFIRRTEKAITTRELISDPAISTVLTEKFDAISDVYVAGYGRSEQMRDVVIFDDMAIHVGNKADIYIKAPFYKATVSGTTGTNGYVNLAALAPHGHIAHVLGVSYSDGEGNAVQPSFSVEVVEKAWLSYGAACGIYASGVVEGTDVEIEFLYVPEVKEVSEFVDGIQRVACYDPMVKSMHPIVLSFNLTVTPKEGVAQDALETQVNSAVQAYVRGLRYRSPYTESTLIEFLHTQVPGLAYIQVPINAAYTLYNEKDMVFVSGNCGSSFTVPEIVGLSNQLTANTTQLYTSESHISFA